jgi:molybdate transport system regulatory protein
MNTLPPDSPVLSLLGELSLSLGQDGFVNRKRLRLLAQIEACGSISAAARAVGISYKTAWDWVDAMNNLSPLLLVLRNVGGKDGGGAVLTPYARRLLAAWEEIEREHRRMLAALAARLEEFEEFSGLITRLLRSLHMQTSARNQFLGTISQVKHGPINAEVVLTLKGGDQIVAVVTDESVKSLGLKQGGEAFALIKAPHVILLREDAGIKTSARNRFCGTVTRLLLGPVNAEVVLELAGGTAIKATVTEEAVRELDIREGIRLCAIIKASHVILAVQA